jgi:hypothetical protein
MAVLQASQACGHYRVPNAIRHRQWMAPVFVFRKEFKSRGTVIVNFTSFSLNSVSCYFPLIVLLWSLFEFGKDCPSIQSLVAFKT